MTTKLAQVDADAFCLGARWISTLPKLGRLLAEVETRMRKVVEVSEIVVVAVRVKVPGYPDGVEYLADVKTGSLYDMEMGRCMTSSCRRIVRTGPVPVRRRS